MYALSPLPPTSTPAFKSHTDLLPPPRSQLIKKLAPPPPPARKPDQNRRLTLRAPIPGAPVRPELHVSRPSDEAEESKGVEGEDEDEEDEDEDEGSTDGASSDSSSENGSEDDEERLKTKKKETSYIETVFGGSLASVLVCEECQVGE